ncbi:MAG: MFS transporter [Ignavibacteriales bacterium CG18_big_fil_WC_8_21_14_2_50_31_20]|nr:MAG: MFS transporter [Ignavibacteriales bacterium CG18_big_fil_WC_8_21_14_2_50_31_20]
MNETKKTSRNPWAWVPTLYYAEGIPYIIVMAVSVIMYKRLGISNTDIALYTSWLYLPWVIKPLWSPIVDIFKTKRFWIITMQLFIGAGLAGVALTIPVPDFFKFTLMFFWLLAFSSATHDIAADGFYMLGLSEHKQAYFVGIRSTFYRLAMITGQGLLIILAGYFESTTGLPVIDINVNAKPNAIVQIVNPDSLKMETLDGDLKLIASSSQLDITTAKTTQAKVDSIIALVRNLNGNNGFYEVEGTSFSKNNSPTKTELSAFEKFIKNTFGIEKPIVNKSLGIGNVGIVYFYLTNKPTDDEIVVNFGSNGGDKSISLIEGTRFTFNKSNWNKPAFAVFQLDPKLNKFSSASFQARSGNIKLSWIITFSILTGLFLLFFIYHKIILPYSPKDKSAISNSNKSIFREFIDTFVIFFKRDKIGVTIAFLLLYRLGESQLVKLASPFLLDAREVGGLGLTTGEVGLVYGTVGIIALTLGGILGGFVAAKHGLKKWLWWMLIAINLPNTVYIYLSYAMPESFVLINIAVAVEQFGYGFGFTAYMLYMIYVSNGEYKTAHFAITTAFMALGMMIPGMVSGWLQELIGYQHFFIWVVIATIPAFIVAKYVPIDDTFGMKED